jgi:7,8-didemethyl-8-hydroxy-5-deazariboflavin synthase CofG subunit
MMLDGVDACVEENLYKNSLSKKYEIRLKSLDWAGKLNIPIATGFTIGIGESMDFRRRMLEDIANIHRTYANVHEVVLQPFSPDPKVVFSGKVPSRDLMLQLVGIAKNILPADINVIVPYSFIANDLADFLNAGINDLGRIPDQYNPIPSQLKPVDFKELEQKVTDLGYTLQQRFPLRLPYIKEARYSKKLGQVFDAYRYKIKKEEQEKQKDLKINPK